MQGEGGIRQITISVRGRSVPVPALDVGPHTVLVTGRWLRVARIRDEDWLEDRGVEETGRYMKAMADAGLTADIFTFVQRPPNVTPRFDYPMEEDNAAVIPLPSFDAWWQSLPQEARKNVRRAARMGIRVRELPFDDATLRGIVSVNNETPVRQGRPFWHYGKGLDVVRRDYATFLDRSTLIGAFHEDQLVGFVKLVYMGDIAAILQILCMNAHQDKRPANALIAEAVKLCVDRGATHLLYGKYVYGRNAKSPLTEFKRRNGFQHMPVPRYHVPLTLRGRLAVRTGLHHGIKHWLPEGMLDVARTMRARLAVRKLAASTGASQDLRPE